MVLDTDDWPRGTHYLRDRFPRQRSRDAFTPQERERKLAQAPQLGTASRRRGIECLLVADEFVSPPDRRGRGRGLEAELVAVPDCVTYQFRDGSCFDVRGEVPDSGRDLVHVPSAAVAPGVEDGDDGPMSRESFAQHSEYVLLDRQQVGDLMLFVGEDHNFLFRRWPGPACQRDDPVEHR
jgi:hypothetical protein